MRIPDTAKRAITLDQLEQVLHFVQEQFESGNPWYQNDGDLIKSIDQVTLYDMNNNLILPVTREYDCSLVELLAESEQPPDYFVSHWWGGE